MYLVTQIAGFNKLFFFYAFVFLFILTLELLNTIQVYFKSNLRSLDIKTSLNGSNYETLKIEWLF